MLKRNKINRGFTLIELMVAVALFLVVMTISMGSILSVFDANRKSKAVKTAISNLNLAMESMSKEIRFGTRYHCGAGDITIPQDCSAADNASRFSFLSSNGQQITYRQSIQGSLVKFDNVSGQYVGVTGPDIIIQDLDFRTVGSNPSDTLQPKTIIIVRGRVGTGSDILADFAIQTTVSQRVLDR